ncbi:MAG: 3-dehydroquinate synthase [Alphaproteobacteria bacterium]|nr:3-dehydroquinate synthase [Alphaproteobacteria bacterium]
MSRAGAQIVHVALGDRAYDIHVGAGILPQTAGLIRPLLRRGRVGVITDGNVALHHLPALLSALGDAGISHAVRIVPAGEQSKNFQELEALLDWMLAEKIERGDLLLAFGGGVIGDLAGFAAAVLRRGVDFAQIPTTLLAQVDSSIGGKTGINSRHGKNLIGAFHQPRIVISDVALLDTLPVRELLAGYAEVVKYGLIGDAAFFGWLESNGAALRDGGQTARIRAVMTSCAAKAALVVADERESGPRALLNLGHTFGHALEAETGYSDRLLHGEGVSIGMCLAFDLAAKLGLASADDAARVARHLSGMGMPTRIGGIAGGKLNPDHLLAHMAQDKKVAAGRINFVLPRGIGDCFMTSEVDARIVLQVLTASAE